VLTTLSQLANSADGFFISFKSIHSDSVSVGDLRADLSRTFLPIGNSSVDFDRQASAMNGFSFLARFPPKANNTVGFFDSFD
jgi:hypothetical protein